MVRDPAETGPRRLAALGSLTGPGPWRRREASAFAGVARRGPDTGLVPDPVSLSPSQAEAYLTCPRLYAFRRRLQVDSGGTVYLDFGSLIHAVLEEVERAALERGDSHATLDEALDALDEHFDPSAFGGEPWASAWHAKAVRVLTHLYEKWPGRGRVAAVEHPVEMEIAGTLWRGRVDRIEIEERPDEEPLLRIVDYKTGTNTPTVPEAARSVQLGFYVLAARRDPRLSELGFADAAELWFPATRAVNVTTRSLDTGRLDEVAGLMQQAAAGITAEDWTPVTGRQCERCPVRLVCPEWPEGREAYLG
jgi:RecB family exonuclease